MEPPPPQASKLRFMCSYGGRIIPRPHTKSLYYAGGDTRIVTVPVPPTNSGISLAALITHLSSSLHLPYPFHLKYQLPNHDLDSLISLSTDDDLPIMLDEYRLLSSGAPCRIRLFVFPAGPEGNPELKHPKRESFFVDALNGVVGFNGGGEEGGSGGPESIVLETSSSFGSTSSSVSLSNLPVKASSEDGSGGLMDKKPKPGNSETGSGDNVVAASVYCPLAGNFHDQAGSFAVMENNKQSTNPFESECRVLDPSHGVEVQTAVQASGLPMSYQPQQVQYVPMGAAYCMPHSQSGIAPASSYYPLSSMVSQQQQLYYQTNQPQAVYYVPVGQAYNLPVQGGLVNTGMVPQSCAPVHPNTAVNVARVRYNVPAASTVPELSAQAYRTLPVASSLIDVPQQENHEQGGGVSQVSNPALATGVAPLESSNTGYVHLDDFARMQIYKSQPPPPSLPSQYQTVANATPHLLSEAFDQLHVDNTKQQLRTAQPQ